MKKTFNHLLGILTLVLIFQGCATAPRPTTETSSTKPTLPYGVSTDLNGLDAIPVIDAHTHTDFTGEPEETSEITYTEEEYLRELKEAGVVGTVSHSSRHGKLSPAPSFKTVRCLGVVPKRTVAEADRLLKDGTFRCLKVYLGYEHRWASDTFYRKFYDLARKHKVPVVLHTGDTYDTNGKVKYADPMTIDEIAVEYRDVNFVIAHLGNPWIESAAEILYKNPNVYADVSALLIGDFSTMDPADIQEYIEKPVAWAFGYIENPKKLMFGTDWPLMNIKDYKAPIARAIPREHWKAVFHDNAARVFGLNKDVEQAPKR